MNTKTVTAGEIKVGDMVWASNRWTFVSAVVESYGTIKISTGSSEIRTRPNSIFTIKH